MAVSAERIRLSIIVPVLDDAEALKRLLGGLVPITFPDVELIVVDGGSMDYSVAVATAAGAQVVRAPRGRATQMNEGALHARGERLWFVHADAQVPAQLLRRVRDLDTGPWGWCDAALDDAHPMLRLVAWCMNRRARLTAVATGDQGMFVRRRMFLAAGGWPEIPLMEDVAFSKRMRKHVRPVVVSERILVDARRWRTRGIIRTVLQMWWLRLGYFLGADPQRLHARYYGGPS